MKLDHLFKAVFNTLQGRPWKTWRDIRILSYLRFHHVYSHPTLRLTSQGNLNSLLLKARQGRLLDLTGNWSRFLPATLSNSKISLVFAFTRRGLTFKTPKGMRFWMVSFFSWKSGIVVVICNLFQLSSQDPRMWAFWKIIKKLLQGIS